MKKLILITILLLSTTTLVSAQTASKSCPEVVPSYFKQVFQEDWGMLTHFEVNEEIYGDRTPTLNNVSCMQFKRLAVVIRGVKKRFGKYLLYPKELVVNMVEKDSNAYNFQGYLNLPKSLFMYSKKFELLFKHPKHNTPVWAHEYGHSVFNQMMSVSSKNWSRLQSALTAYKNQMVSFTSKHNPLLRSCKIKAKQMQKSGASKEQINSQLAVECGNPIKKLRMQSNMAADAIGKRIEPMMDLMMAAKAYNEFFADVITVAYLDNGSAVHDALHRSGIDYHRSPQKSLGRDFTTHKNDLDVLERLPAHFIQPGEHNLLSAARRHVWKYYLSNPIYKEKIGLTTQTIFKAIVSEVKQLEKVFRSQPTLAKIVFPDQQVQYTPEQYAILKRVVVVMNQNLIKVIDQQLEKL